MKPLLLYVAIATAVLSVNSEANPYADVNINTGYISQEQAIMLSGFAPGDPKGNACATFYDKSYPANNWCHGAISDGIYQTLLEYGAPEVVAHTAPIVVWMIKEHLIDKNADNADIHFAPFIFRPNGDRSSEFKVQCAINGDCSITWHKEW